jgi:hypothetical protein
MSQKSALWIFDDQDPRPLPEIVITKLEGQMAHIDTPEGERLYSVRDWVYYVSVSKNKNVSAPWSDLKKAIAKHSEFKVSEILRVLEVETSGGKQAMDFTDEYGLYAITQRMSDRSGMARAVKQYLVNAGVLVDEIRRDEDAAAGLIENLETRHKRIREQGKKKRINFVQTAKDTHEKGRPNYAAITNAEYEVLFGAAKDELVKSLALTPAQANRFRDHISTLALQAIDASETAGAIKMQQLGRKLTTPEQIEIVRTCARLVAPGFWALADYLNVDLLSGKPRLDSGLSQ